MKLHRGKVADFSQLCCITMYLRGYSSSFNQEQRKMTRKKKIISHLINRCLSVKYLAKNLSKY